MLIFYKNQPNVNIYFFFYQCRLIFARRLHVTNKVVGEKLTSWHKIGKNVISLPGILCLLINQPKKTDNSD